jgi:RNA polymerase sigma-70 factor (ECF subfamily)
VRTRLVERAQRGDQDAFGELVGLEGDRCYAVAIGILRDIELARDSVQQAFLLAWRDLPTLRDPERFGPWLHRILVHACYEESRRQRRWTTRIRALTPDEAELPDRSDPTIDTADRDALERAFARLKPEHRAVVVLHHHVGMPLAEIADVVRVPVGTVKSRLHYATRILRSALTEPGTVELSEEVPA